MVDRVQNLCNDTSNAINADGASTMAVVTTKTQVNLFHDEINFSSSEGKKLCQKSIQGFPIDQKNDGNPKETIKFVDSVQSKIEDLG